MPKVFSLETTAGILTAEAWESEDYPGITIYINGHQLVVVECKQNDEPEQIHVAVWENDAQDPIRDDNFQFLAAADEVEWVRSNI